MTFFRRATVPKTMNSEVFKDIDYYCNWLLFSISKGELTATKNLVTHWTWMAALLPYW